MTGPIVVVHGEAHREVPPEQAVFSVVVSAADRDRAVVLSRLSQRAAEIGTILDRYGPAIERRETAGVQVYPEFKRGGERVTSYAGSVATTVTATDFAALGMLLADIAARESASVSGPWWQLRRGSRAGADVRREAVADALDRAREYAAAVGSEIDRIVEIADAEAGGAHPMMRGAFGAFGAAEAADAATGFDLFPQQQTVEARVLLRVTITEPTVLGRGAPA
ncbi:SIMPL domain-containing protein [Actinoplanes sp. GCM10030250]|uniref:SIMPL domain-containing protein n=1 Tax=Actinoplanes sp. GCM10030250 TaxID=3273376 RepID=UPI003619A2EE